MGAGMAKILKMGISNSEKLSSVALPEQPGVRIVTGEFGRIEFHDVIGSRRTANQNERRAPWIQVTIKDPVRLNATKEALTAYLNLMKTRRQIVPTVGANENGIGIRATESFETVRKIRRGRINNLVLVTAIRELRK
ncbi:MAG: hypothetical protein V1817_04370 [Candidatus Micrarchaeota archaeon]